MLKQRTRLVEECDTIYEIDENCMKKKKRSRKTTDREKKNGQQRTFSPKPPQ